MNRIWNVVRMHLVNRWSYIALPWVIVGSAFAMTVAIWFIVIASGAGAPTLYSGAAGAILIYELVLAVQAVNFTFPFALGFSATRREFVLGTGLTFLILAAANAVVLAALATIEEATNGWGIHGQLFSIAWAGNVAATWFVFFALQLVFIATGAVIASIYLRWRTNGMVVTWGVLGVLFVGGFALVSYVDAWPRVGEWLFTTGPLGLVAWTLVPTALFGIATWLVLRRAAPKG